LNNRQPVENDTDKFLKFVNEQIDKMKKYASLGAEEEISFYSLNNALRSYEGVYLTLISLYNIARIELQQKEEEYQNWYAEKFIYIKNRENRIELTAQKWASQKELELMVRNENQFELQGWKEELRVLENKESFLKRLLDAWQSQQFILSTLSKNIIAEVGASSMDRVM